MRFRIHCSNPKTGQAHDFELDAPSHDEAQREVLAAGLVVIRIEATDDQPDAPPARIPPRPLAAQREARRERRHVRTVGRVIGACTVVALVFVLVGSILSGSSDATGYLDIQASVRFDGEQFRIANMDDFPWQNILIDINGGLANSGYTLRWDVLTSQQAIVAAAIDFVDDKGNRYDPANEPLSQLRIICEIGDGNKALHMRRWSDPETESNQ
jgi:hypothetical protein